MKVFVSFYHHFLDLAKILASRGHEIYTHPDFQKMLTDTDIKAINIAEKLDTQGKFDSMLYSVNLLRASPHLIKHIPAYEHLDNPSKKFFEAEIDAFLYQRIANLSMVVAALDIARPDIVVVHNDVDPMQRLIALWAKGNGVPCLHVPHAIYIDEIDRGPIGSDIHDIVTASHLASSGDYQSQWYKKRGMRPENIRETGIPALNKQVVGMHKGRSSRLLGLNPSLPTVTYASSWRQDTNLLGCHNGVDEWYEGILDAMKLFPVGSVQLIVKTHPNSPALQVHMEMAKAKDVRCLVTATHLEPVLGASDLLISYGPSNIIIEAAFLVGPRLSCTHGYQLNQEIYKFGEDVNVPAIAESIKALLSTPRLDYNNFRSMYCRYSDGRNNERIVQYIEDIVATSGMVK